MATHERSGSIERVGAARRPASILGLHRRATTAWRKFVVIAATLLLLLTTLVTVGVDRAQAQVSSCTANTITGDDVVAVGAPYVTFPAAGGGASTMTMVKTGGVDSQVPPGTSAPVNALPGAAGVPVAGFWLGSDDLFGAKFVNEGLDEETYELTFDAAALQVQLRFGAVNLNADGDERIEIIRVEDAAGADITASSTFAFTDLTAPAFGSIGFNPGSLIMQGTFFVDSEAGGTYGNSNARISIEEANGIGKIVFRRFEVDSGIAGSTKLQPARNRSNGVTLEVSYCDIPVPSIEIDKQQPTISSDITPLNVVSLGDELEYSFVVTNTGDTVLSDVAVNDPLVGLSTPVCPAGDLQPGATVTCTASYTVSPDDVRAGQIVNGAISVAVPPVGPPVQSDPDTEVTVVVPGPEPAIGLDKLAPTNRDERRFARHCRDRDSG